MYASVEEMKAEAADVRRKENTAAKFTNASITFNTFKPVKSQLTSLSVSQSELDINPQRHWHPNFSQNYNLAAQRQLARSYETVILMPKSETNANQEDISVKNLSQGDETDEDYENLVYREGTPTMTSQRNFSISCSKNPEITTDYSELMLQECPHHPQPGIALANDEEEKVKPNPKKRTSLPNPRHSYTAVKKFKTRPLPPLYDPRIAREVEEDEAEETEYYNVPAKWRRASRSGHYDRPSSLIRVALSCENLKSTPASAEVLETGHYDIPSSILPYFEDKKGSMVLGQLLQLSFDSLSSQDSYVDMTATRV